MAINQIEKKRLRDGSETAGLMFKTGPNCEYGYVSCLGHTTKTHREPVPGEVYRIKKWITTEHLHNIERLQCRMSITLHQGHSHITYSVVVTSPSWMVDIDILKSQLEYIFKGFSVSRVCPAIQEHIDT